LLPCAAAIGVLLHAAPARAGDLDLDDDDTKPKEEDQGLGTWTPPVATIKARTYSLAECLALAERNHPMVWAAKARLAFVRAQLDEARWTPFWQVWANSTFGILPPGGGSTATQASFPGAGWKPFVQYSLDGAVPLYTFGKISTIKRAAEGQVRVNEWDMDKVRRDIRLDVRRAYWGLMLTRDARYIIEEIIRYLDKNIASIKKKLAKHDANLEDVDRLRLEVLRDETLARSEETTRGATFAMAALRFLTGIQTAFDIPDEPLKRTTKTLAPVVQYLSAARLFRGDVNRARAGVAARQAWVEFQRARMFPDFALGYRFSYGEASSAPIDAGDKNYFFFGVAFAMRWSLDILPQAARVAQAEAQLEEVRALERYALGGVAVEVENAYGTALEAKNREENWARAEHRTRQWISTIQDAIDLGTKDERAIMEPLRSFVNARVQHIYAMYDLNIALADLARVSAWEEIAPTE
jgi:outer membrane protein TolC